MGKHFTKFVKFANHFTKFVEFANNFAKFVGLGNNFNEVHRSCKQLYKVCGLANNFCKVHKTRTNFKFVDWKVGFNCLKVFPYLCFTHLNILIGKHKCSVNTFHVSWILFTNNWKNRHYSSFWYHITNHAFLMWILFYAIIEDN